MNKLKKYLVSTGGIIEEAIAKKKLGQLLPEFEEKTINFAKSQEETLNKIIEKNQATRWGRDHSFSKLNAKTWKNAPIITYEDLRPYFERIRNGDFFALTSSSPKALAITSGTTSDPKFILLTDNAIASQKKGADIWNAFLYQAHGENLKKILVLSGGAKQKDLEVLPVNSYTQIVKAKQSSYVKKRMAFPKAAEGVLDLEHRLLISAQAACIDQPTALISVNPTTALRLLDLAGQHESEILNATINGLYVGTDIPLRGIKNKKQVLDRIASKNPLASIKIMGTWLGGTQNLFLDKLKTQGVNIPMRDLGYLATEGRFTIPIQDNSPAGVLNPFGNFYEFMTLDKKNLVPLQDLKQGTEYNMILTSENGLYRYDIQDVVMMNGWYNSAPVLSFRRKDACFSSITGEKLHENNVVELLRQLKLDKGFLVAKKDPFCYELVLQDSYDKKGEIDVARIDNMLQQLNPEYHSKRENSRLGPLRLSYLSEPEFKCLDDKINPNQEHDRFKRKYLVPLK